MQHNMFSDLECGGFTYRGAKGVDQPFLIHFFRVLPPYSTLLRTVGQTKDRLEQIWTSYKVKRKFVALPGRPYVIDQQLGEGGQAVAKFVDGLRHVWSLEEQSQVKKSKAASKLVLGPDDLMGVIIDPLDMKR